MAVLGVVVIGWLASRTDHDERPAHREERPATRALHYDPEETERARETLRILVQTHPAREIREDLNRLVEQNIVSLNFQGDELLASQNSIASALYFDTPDGRRLTLVVSISLLLDPDVTQAFQQLVIYHEYIHIRQQLDRTQPPWLLTGQVTTRISEADLRIFFNAEMEAYEAECRLAEQIGATDAFDLCQVYSEQGLPAMRLAYARILGLSPAYGPVSGSLIRIAEEP